MRSTQQSNEYFRFQTAVSETPESSFERSRQLADLISEQMRQLMNGLRGLSFAASPNDPAFELEAAMYAFVKQSNPDCSELVSAEGLGTHLQGPRERRDRALETVERRPPQ